MLVRHECQTSSLSTSSHHHKRFFAFVPRSCDFCFYFDLWVCVCSILSLTRPLIGELVDCVHLFCVSPLDQLVFFYSDVSWVLPCFAFLVNFWAFNLCYLFMDYPAICPSFEFKNGYWFTGFTLFNFHTSCLSTCYRKTLFSKTLLSI